MSNITPRLMPKPAQMARFLVITPKLQPIATPIQRKNPAGIFFWGCFSVSISGKTNVLQAYALTIVILVAANIDVFTICRGEPTQTKSGWV
jgi:hypothetical protein